MKRKRQSWSSADRSGNKSLHSGFPRAERLSLHPVFSPRTPPHILNPRRKLECCHRLPACSPEIPAISPGQLSFSPAHLARSPGQLSRSPEILTLSIAQFSCSPGHRTLSPGNYRFPPRIWPFPPRFWGVPPAVWTRRTPPKRLLLRHLGIFTLSQPVKPSTYIKTQ